MTRPKIKALVLDSDFSGVEVNVNIGGGFCQVDIDKNLKYDFFVDKTRPIKIIKKSLFGNKEKDLYIFSWKSLVPLEFELRKEIWKKEELVEKMRENNFTEEEIEKIIDDIRKKEAEGYNMNYFVYKTLEPVIITSNHWSKTELPTIVRDTINMRFLKSLKQYVEPKKTELGRGMLIVLAILIIISIVFYSIMSSGAIKIK